MNSQASAEPQGPVKEVLRLGGTTVVKLTGDIDMYCSPAVRKVLMEATAARVPSLAIDVTDAQSIEQAARCVELDDEGPGAVSMRCRDRFVDEVGRRGVDRRVERDDVDRLGRRAMDHTEDCNQEKDSGDAVHE